MRQTFFLVKKTDAGIGMTEIAVAIVLLGIVVVGLFPMVIDSVRLAVQNAEVAQANQIVATQLDRSRDQLSYGVCVPETEAPILLPASESNRFQADRTVECAVTGLATVRVRVQLLSDSTRNVAEAATQVVSSSP